MEPSRRFLLVVCGLGLALLLASLRFSAPEFRALELLREKDGFLFERSRRVEMVEIGDLGWKSWVRPLQHPRRVVFTTDRWGFRNPRDIERPSIVVVGDSYVMGVGVSDEQTLSERLSARLGVPVYNYGLELGATPQLFFADPRWKAAPPRLLIYAPVQRLLRPRPLRLRGDRWPERRAPAGLLATWREWDGELQRFVTGLNRDNALAVTARYTWNGLRYRLFGLPGTAFVDGGTVLLLPFEQQLLDVPAAARQPEQVIATAQRFRAMLAERGIELLFCPIPEAATIYPELYTAAEQARIARPSLLDLVVDGARRGGVATVDLRPVFQKNRSPYLFLPDDSHWNARAIDLAAEALAEAARGGGR